MPETLVSNEIIPSSHKDDDKGKSIDTKELEVVGESNNQAEPEAAAAITTSNYDLNTFRLERILNNNTRNKSIALLGNFPTVSDSDNAIVIFEKQAFEVTDVATNEPFTADVSNGREENGIKALDKEDVEVEQLIKPSYFCTDLKVHTEFINNIYGSYKCTPPANLNDVKATVVYPATDKHVEKYSISQKYLICEDPQLYKEVTLPYINSSQFSLEWVYNILEHKQETERIIFEDPDPETGFILLPDLKWNGQNIENMYALAIAHKRDIKSLRDLNDSHLPLLRNIRKLAAEAIEKRYDLHSTQLRMYFHYQPSFYHIHVHINLVGNDAPGIWCEKSHMLDTVINNLELLSDYYEKATLPFVLYDGNKLLETYEAKIPVRKAKKRLAEAADEDEEVKVEKQYIEENHAKEKETD